MRGSSWLWSPLSDSEEPISTVSGNATTAQGTTPTGRSEPATAGRDGFAAGPSRSRCQGPLPAAEVNQRDHPAAHDVDG
jgi:hypothetical protein